MIVKAKPDNYGRVHPVNRRKIGRCSSTYFVCRKAYPNPDGSVLFSVLNGAVCLSMVFHGEVAAGTPAATGALNQLSALSLGKAEPVRYRTCSSAEIRAGSLGSGAS